MRGRRGAPSVALMTTDATAQRSSVDPEERLDQLLTDLGTRRDGLSDREAARRLVQHGRNEVVRRSADGHWRSLVAQFTHPLALLLWAAAFLAWVAGIVV